VHDDAVRLQCEEHAARSMSGKRSVRSRLPEYRRRRRGVPPGSAQETVTRRRAVAAYDFTFSIPKSASILWGVADAATQARMGQAHHEAVSDAVAYIEREVATTRTGTDDKDRNYGVRRGRCSSECHGPDRLGVRPLRQPSRRSAPAYAR
jgi:hypothetical protein